MTGAFPSAEKQRLVGMCCLAQNSTRQKESCTLAVFAGWSSKASLPVDFSFSPEVSYMQEGFMSASEKCVGAHVWTPIAFVGIRKRVSSYYSVY